MRSLLQLALLGTLVSCGGGSASTTPSPSPTEDLGTKHQPAPDPQALAKADPKQAEKAPPPEVTKKPEPPPPPLAGVDFIADAKLLWHVAACGGPDTERIPDEMTNGDAARKKALESVAAGHCKYVGERIADFKKTYFGTHRAWFDEHVPKTIPKTVVYPFGGGDLISALVAFPDATEITTISLEQAGDPRRIKAIRPDQLSNSLGSLRVEIGGLIWVGSNTSVNLSAGQRNELPGQVSSFMMGLVAGGYEPVSMRYFKLDDDGSIHYMEQAEIDASDATAKKKGGKSLKDNWASPNFSEAFQNVEIQYKKPGESTVHVHRHIGWNLGDDYLKKNDQLLKHLEAKGKVTILTKGGSYMLQRPDFSIIRKYMLDHLAWMLSDSTGIAPIYAEPAGMVQETFGTYSGALLGGAAGNKVDLSFVKLFRTNPQQKLAFRFGYVDGSGANHLIITRPK